MFAMRLGRGIGAVGIAVVAALGIAPRPAHAQAAPPFDPAIDVSIFNLAIGPKTFFSVSEADVAAKKQLAVDAMVTFLTNPFVVYNDTGSGKNMITGTRDTVVSSVTEAQFSGAYGVTDKIQIGAMLPVIFSLQGSGLDPTTGMADANGLQVTGLGDLLVEGKMRLWRDQGFAVAGLAGVTIPTSFGSDGSQFIGDNLPTFRAGVAGQYTKGAFSAGANLGFLLRKPRTIYSDTIGQQLTWGVAAAYRITDRFSVVGEGFGRAGLFTFDRYTSPVELDAGLRVIVATSFAVVLGGGGGVIKGAIGSPELQFFASVGYAPDLRDSDGDGIPNSRDNCPLVPEDKDGFQDEDGCPDDDNDGDGIPDKDDKCPNQAEDHDGFQDDDGCPDPDNDKDGILDLDDKCPNDPEDGKPPYPKDGCPADKRDSDGDGIPDLYDQCPLEAEDYDGFEDGDGCPDLDNDGDGIPDDKDKCPLCPEDKDGFQDEDGCPDYDNDHDGIPDTQDQCPNEPETINGYKDDDGCPDTGGAVLVHFDADRMAIDRVPALDGRQLSAAGAIVVGEMTLTMLGHPEVTKWLVAISMPSAKDAALAGEAIKARLEQKGVLGVSVASAAGPAKIAAVVQERADANAMPMCAPGKEAKQRPDAIKPKALMPGFIVPTLDPNPARSTPAPDAEPEITPDGR